MAFDSNKLVAVASGPSPTVGSTGSVLAMYATNDTAAIIETAGYFNGAATDLSVGSMIYAAIDLDGTPAHKSYLVSANDGVTVTITPAATVTFSAIRELTRRVDDIATAATHRIVAPVSGTITAIRSVIASALATGDATITARINSVPVTGGVITVTQAASAAGDVDVATPTAANIVAVGDVIELVVGGANTAAVEAMVTMTIVPS